MLAQLSDMSQEIEKLQQIQAQRLTSEQELVNLNERSALISEINSLGSAIESHSFNTASPRYASKRRHTEALARQATLRQVDYEMVQFLLTRYDKCLQQQQLAEFNVRLIQFKLEGSSWHNEYLALVDVLQLHLPAKTLERYDNTRSQIDELFGRLSDLGLQCVEHMLQYAAIMSYYPEQRHRDNVYVRFHDSYSGYLQNVDSSSSLSLTSINKDCKLSAAETLESVWMDLNCQLHQLNQHFANDQAMAQSHSPSHSLLVGIGQSNCSQSQLNAALIRTLGGATTVFGDYEQSALQAHNPKLGQQQLQFIQLVRSMCQGVVEPLEQANYQLTQLQDALTALVQLQHCFELELPTSVFRLLLLGPNLDHLQALLQLSPESLADRYNLFVIKQQDQQQTMPLSVEQQFLLCLQPAYGHFNQLIRALEKITRIIKLIVDDDPDQSQQCMVSCLLDSFTGNSMS